LQKCGAKVVHFS